MCGITGVTSWRQSPEHMGKIVSAMTAALQHRGPDASGKWTAEHVAFGHTRLAIIDPAGGGQPMYVRRPGGGLVAITFSGEVYNHREIRLVLEGADHKFTGHSDTEVVLHAYLQWGSAFVDRLRGMYALAIWDSDAGRLVLVRDRLGIKPLYLTRTSTEVVFASEIKALLAHPDVTAEIDDTGLAELVALVPMTSPGHAVLADIEEVPPATILQIDCDGVRSRRYWKLSPRRHPHDRATTVRHVRELLEQAVIEQCVADVPIGALNSGGVDSASVAALAARALDVDGEQLSTFDILHTGQTAHASSAFHRTDDHAFALLVAEHIKSEHVTIEVSTQDLLNAHAATLHAMDLPSLTTINASLYVLFSRISPHRRVLLSGEGSDELFAGYTWHQGVLDGGDVQYPWTRTYQPLSGLLTRDALHRLQPARYARDRYREALEQLSPVDGETAQDRRFREIKWLTVMHYLPFLLRRKDRMSMASGVEARVPFLDHRLVDYSWNIPPSLLTGIDIEKRILREAVQDLLPDEVTWRPKSGYPASLTAAYQAAIWQRARDLIADPTTPALQLVDRTKLAALLNRHEGDLSDWTPLQLTCYVLELDTWLRDNRVHIR